MPQRQPGDAFCGCRDDLVHRLALSLRQTVDRIGLGFSPAGRLDGIPRPLQRAIDARDQLALGKRLLDEIDGADLHGLDRGLHVAATGDHDGRQPVPVNRQPLEQLDAAHPRHVQIDDEASAAIRTIGRKECLGACVGFDRPAFELEQEPHVVAHHVVVVDDEDGGRLGVVGGFRGLQLLRRHRFFGTAGRTPKRARRLLGLRSLVDLNPHQLCC